MGEANTPVPDPVPQTQLPPPPRKLFRRPLSSPATALSCGALSCCPQLLPFSHPGPMARRMAPSSSRSNASWAFEEPFGKETGLPLIVCPKCGRERVIELIVKSTENGNQGRVFFKCPRNIVGMPGRCFFYEFQKFYLKKLVELKYVVIDIEAGMAYAEEGGAAFADAEEAQSQVAPQFAVAGCGKLGKNSMEDKMDALISVARMVVAAMLFCGFVGLMYLFK